MDKFQTVRWLAWVSVLFACTSAGFAAAPAITPGSWTLAILPDTQVLRHFVSFYSIRPNTIPGG